jgi:hypothetical protein
MKVAAYHTNPDGVVVISEKEEKTAKKDRIAPVHSGDDVASKFSDLSESSTDPHNEENGTKSSSHRRPLRSTRSEDYENFEKMLRNKHSKACKAMSVRSFQSTAFACVRETVLSHHSFI